MPDNHELNGRSRTLVTALSIGGGATLIKARPRAIECSWSAPEDFNRFLPIRAQQSNL